MKKKKNKFIKILLVLVLLITALKYSGFIREKFSRIKERNLNLDNNCVSYENIISRNAAVMDRNTSKIIVEKKCYDRIHPASMTKVMTAIIGLESVENLNKRITMSADIINYCNVNDLSVSGFQQGDKPKVIDLLYGILLESGGESSIALAREVSGSEEKFTKLMNQKAKEIGMVDTHFSNATGITDSKNYSTSRDIALLFDYALKNGKFKKIIKTKEYTAHGLRGASTKHVVYNKLFEKINCTNINKNCIQGGKTGYTQAAGLCLVSFGTVNGREYIVVTAGANGDPTTPQYNLIDSFKLYKKTESY